MAVITACAVNVKPSKATAEPTVMLTEPTITTAFPPTILNGATAVCPADQPQKIVTDLPVGVRYAIRQEQIDPTTIDAGKIVPAGYTALDYIQGTGTQWLDTGFSTTTGMTVDMKTSCYTMGSYRGTQQYPPFSEGANGLDSFTGDGGPNFSDTVYGLIAYGSHAYFAVRTYTGSERPISVVKFSTCHGFLEKDGERKYTTVSGKTNGANVGLFSIYQGRYCDDGKIIYTKFWNSADKLVRDFVPVRSPNNQLGMYDVLNHKFYANAGTGEFVASSDVNTAIKDWEWLDSVDDPRNERVLAANTKYYVYYYLPNTDTTLVSPLAVSSFTVNDHVYGEWQNVGQTQDNQLLQQRVCTICGGGAQERMYAPGSHCHHLTIKGNYVTNELVITATVYTNQATPFGTLQALLDYLNSLVNFDYLVSTGSVRYYDPYANRWCSGTVTKFAGYGGQMFTYYYTKNDVVTIPKHTTITDLSITDNVPYTQ